MSIYIRVVFLKTKKILCVWKRNVGDDKSRDNRNIIDDAFFNRTGLERVGVIGPDRD